MKGKDITDGLKIGRWTIIKTNYSRVGGKKTSLCRCDCGNVKAIRTDSLARGDSLSCGCLVKETNTKLHSTHGLSKTAIFNNWKQMIERCENPKKDKYAIYGARGISVYDEWHNPEIFYEWALNNGYKKGLTLDRIDVNGNYCPENCRFITPKQQSRDTRYNHMITYNGETRCLSEWCEILDLNFDTTWARLKRGWSVEDALTKPLGWRKSYKKNK